VALSRTDYAIQQSHSRGASSADYTTASLSLPASALVLVIASGNANNNAAIRPTSFTLANSAGLTMTQVVTTGDPVQWGYGIRVWRMETTGAVSSTFTVGATVTHQIEMWDVAVIAYTGYDTATPIGGTATGTDANGTGSATITLSASPASGDEAIGAVSGVVNSGAPAVTHGTGWSEIGESTQSGWGYFEYQSRTGSTSTSVLWDNVGSGGSPLEVMLCAFVVKDAGGAASVPDSLLTMPPMMPPMGARR
jgi:hypothetical protein